MTDNLEEKKVCKICYTVSSHKSKQVLTSITKSITDTRGSRTCTICKQPWIEITVFRERGQQEWVYVKPRPKIGIVSEYQLCTSVEKKLKCAKASKCTFAHSKLELTIWNKERQRDVRSAQQTSRLQLCKHISRGPCPLSNRCMFAHSYEELEKWKTEMSSSSSSSNSSAQPAPVSHGNEHFYCDVCDTICTSKKQLEEHKKGSRHLQAMYSSYHAEPVHTHVRHYPSPIIPRHQAAAAKLQQQMQSSKLNDNNMPVSIRERPKLPFHVLEYRMCRHVQMGRPCLHGDLCTFAHSNEELLAWSKDVTFTNRFERASNIYHPPDGSIDHSLSTAGGNGSNFNDTLKITDKLYTMDQSSETIEDVRDRIRNAIGTLGLESNHYGIVVNEVSGTEMDLTLTEEKMVTWVFEVTFEFPVLLRAVVLLDPLTADFSLVSIKHTNPSGATKEVKGPKIKEGIGYMVDLKLSPSEKIKLKVQLKPHVGIMEQVLIWDFDKCVISRSLSVRLVDQREARLLEYEEGRKANKPKKTDLFWEQHYNIQELEISYGEEADKNLKQYGLPEAVETLIERGEYDNKESEVTKDDYKRRMHNLLFIEEYYQRKEMSKYDLYEIEVKCAKNITRSDGVFGAPSGYVYIELQMDEELFEGGRTVREHDHALVLPSGQLRAFKGVVESVASSEVVLKITERVVKALNTSRNVCSVRFVVDRIKFRAMHYAVDNISLDCIFPTKKSLQKPITADNQDYSRYLELSCLNTKQRNAVVSILDQSCCKIPSLVCGPFGCGKTRTLRECIVLMLLHQLSAKMLICTHSNSAADLYVEDISREWNNFKKEKLSLFRLFYTGRRYNTVTHTVRQYSSIQDFTFVVPDISTLSQYKIIVTTLVTARLLVLMGLSKGHFTHIFVDEAAQALECEALVPLTLADENTKIILAGDHMQIDPSVYSPLARKYGLHISLLERLYHANAYSDGIGKLCKTMLEENHRTHPTILELPSKMFYKNKLKAKAKFPSYGPRDMPPLLFVGAEGQESKDEDSPSYYNKYEAAKVVDKVLQLVEQKIGARDICVLAPYMKQVKMIRFLLRKEHLPEVSVRTVDGVQGLEFRTLIISTVRTCSLLSDNEEDSAGFLSNPKLFNTAITRAKQWLIIVGHPVTLCTVGSNRQCWLEIIKRCIQLESFEYTDPGKFEKYLDYKMMCRQAIEQKRHMSLSPKLDLVSRSLSTPELPSSELFFDDEDVNQYSSSELIQKELDDIETPPPTKTTANAPGLITAPTTTIAANTTTTTYNNNTINASNATTTGNTTSNTTTSNTIAVTSSYSRQPNKLNVQPILAPAVTTQTTIPAQQVPSVKTQPTMSSQQTVAGAHQQQLQYQHSMAQQGQPFNAHLNQPRQPFPMYQMSQQGMRAQQYMMSHPYMAAQPAKIPFIQQHPNQQHMILAAQNSMLQHQLQNASMSVNHHEAPHHLVTQHANVVMNEISDISRILNAEEESLNKLVAIFTTQASLSNVSPVLQDNILQQKVMVDDRLKRLQEQKSLFQQFCELYKNQLYQEAHSNVNYHAAVPNYNVPLTGNLPATGIQPPSNAAMFSTGSANETTVAVSQSSTNMTPSVTNNVYMSGSNQNLSAGGSTPSLSGTSEYTNENVPVTANMGVRTVPAGSVPPGFVHQIVDPNVMSQQASVMMYPQMSQQMTQLSQFSLSQAQLQPQPECHDLYLSDDEY